MKPKSKSKSKPASSRRAPLDTPYQQLTRLVREASLLGSTGSMLSWDQETMMPAGGVELRSEQLAQIARMSHEMATASRIGDLLRECERDAGLLKDPVAAANVRWIRHDYDRKTKLPPELVEEEAKLASLGQHIWAEARKESNFARFRPHLEKIVDMLRRKAKCYGWSRGGEAWDALAEDYEPGANAKDIAAVFTPLRDRLQNLLDDIRSSKGKPSNRINEIKVPLEKQREFVTFIAKEIGFDFNRGRLDTSTHPFCGGSHCNDVRITTRYRDDSTLDALGSVMHECGHGIYEQGLPFKHFGLPAGNAVSLGIHESQSRMWENQVGRSKAFWKWATPHARKIIGGAVAKISADDNYAAANRVKPDFIRVEADEATYNMHIFVRFELERAIIAGDLDVGDIPRAWNAKYKEYLGLKVPDDRRGCLQDVHWSMTAMGYFPTYTLGNLYCAQFFEAALKDIPDLHKQFEKGRFGELKEWLNENIHQHGRRFSAAELCQRVTGKPLNADPLLRHLEGKLRPLYGV
jgi:carboxypeptidase Taq